MTTFSKNVVSPVAESFTKSMFTYLIREKTCNGLSKDRCLFFKARFMQGIKKFRKNKTVCKPWIEIKNWKLQNDSLLMIIDTVTTPRRNGESRYSLHFVH